MKSVKEFLNSGQRNQWLYCDDKKVFVRRSTRYLPEHGMIQCFDIANISIYKPGEGVFTKWLAEIIELAKDYKFDAIYVESVLNPRFAEYFRKLGWLESEEQNNFNFFKVL